MADPVTVTDTEKDIAEIERRLAAWEEMERAATKGPWIVEPLYHGSRTVAMMRSCKEILSVNTKSEDSKPLPYHATEANAELIVAARRLVPVVMAEWRERLRTANAHKSEHMIEQLLAAIPDPKEQ